MSTNVFDTVDSFEISPSSATCSKLGLVSLQHLAYLNRRVLKKLVIFCFCILNICINHKNKHFIQTLYEFIFNIVFINLTQLTNT